MILIHGSSELQQQKVATLVPPPLPPSLIRWPSKYLQKKQHYIEAAPAAAAEIYISSGKIFPEK